MKEISSYFDKEAHKEIILKTLIFWKILFQALINSDAEWECVCAM